MSNEDTPSAPERLENRWHWHWLPGVLLRPRRTFEAITTPSRSGSIWLAPLLVLTAAALLYVFTNGWAQKQAYLMQGPQIPQGFENFPPEMQAQFMQTLEARQGPVFLYVLPGLGAIAGLWFGWLIVSGLSHLLLTMLGGRGETNVTLNVIAWASLPLGIRDLVRTIFLLANRQPIQAAGISGFVDTTSGGVVIFIAALLALIDIYVLWHIVLGAFGAQAATRLSLPKSLIAIGLSVLLVLLAQAGISYAIASLSSLSVIRPFMF